MSEKDKSKKGGKWAARLALIIALIALFLALQERLSTTKGAVRSVNQTMTNQVMPKIKQAADRATVNNVYELKRMVVTLDEIRETSNNDEIKARIDQIKMDLEELGVKILVNE